ncbi:MAG TPA: hypothetical protein VKM55_03070 [Candidatus Lokiarchaeia archaeon]|nr:hypothetical protein [Candidatus Lokiarchaeia archaeon]
MAEEYPKLYIIWKGELKAVNKPIFSTGDSYLLDAGEKVFVWLGENSEPDKKETAAAEAHTIEEDRKLESITIDQGQETDDFFNALKPLGSFRLVNKELVESMLKHVETSHWAGEMEHVNALYKAASEDFGGDVNRMQYEQVPFDKSSLTQNDAFIAELGDEILVWFGSGCNAKDRLMAGQWAYEFDRERAGAPIHYYEEGDDAEFMDKCWGAGIVQASAEKAQVEEGESMPSDEENENMETEPPAEEGEEMESEPPRKVELKSAPPSAKKPAPAPAPKPSLQRTPEPARKPAAAPVPRPVLKPVAEEQEEEPEAPAEDEPVEAPAEESGEEAEVAGEAGQRWQCPKCGNNLRSMIREVTDKTVVLSTYPPIYGKKLICGKCGKEWRQAG